MVNVRVLTNIVPEELVEEAKRHYKEYVKEVPENRKKDLDSYIHWYTKIFLAEEELAVKEKYLEMLKKEVTGLKKEIEDSKHYINFESDISFKEDRNIFSNMVFNDILEIALDSKYRPYSSEEQLETFLFFYFNNIRNIEKEYNFLIEVENIIRNEDSFKNGVPESLINFYEIIKPFYYETQEEIL